MFEQKMQLFDFLNKIYLYRKYYYEKN